MAKIRPDVNLQQPIGGLLRQKRKKFDQDEASALLFGMTRPGTAGSHIVHDRQHRLWYLCIAYYLGQQRQQDLSTMALMTDWLEPSRDEQLYVANHIAPLVSRQITRLIQSKGQFIHIPATPDFRDQRGAKAGSHLLSYWYDELDLRSLRRDVAMWMTLAGTGLSYIDWDDLEGEHHRIYRDPFDDDKIVPAESLTREQKDMLAQYGVVEERAEGDMFAEALSPFELSFPASYDHLDKMPWIRVDRIRSYDWLYGHYPKDAPDVPVETFDGPANRIFFRQLQSLASGVGMSGDLRHLDNAVVVSEFWRPPSALMPNGALLVGSGGVVLHNGPHPSIERDLDIRYPIDRARFQPIPGNFLGQGMVQHLLDPANEYNRVRTQQIQQRDLLSHPQWLATKKPNRLRNDYGDFWIYENGAKPELQPPPPVSMLHESTKGAALYDFQTLSAQSEASQGQNPAGVRSGNALVALQEKDVETVGYAFEEMEHLMAAGATKLLKYSARLLTQPRAIAVYGKAMMADVIYLKGMDLRGNTKVRVMPGSMKPKSEAALRDNVSFMLQIGGLTPQINPEHQRFVNKVFEFQDLDAALITNDLIERRAEAENERFANPPRDKLTGAQAPWPGVEEHDDDIIHLQTHNRFMQTDEYEAMPVDQKLALQAHMFMHQQKLARLAMMQAQAQQAPQGSEPRELGKPSQPKASARPTPASS